MATATALPRTPDGALTLDELAVLMITSPAHIKPEKGGETVIVTTKDAYLWAVLFSELAGRDGEPEEFLKAFRDYLREHGHVYRLLLDTLGNASEAESLAKDMLTAIASKYDLNYEGLMERANAAYLSLIEKKLVEDPFKKKIATFVLCVSVLIPTNVTSTTEKGGKTAQTYHSAWVDVKHKKDSKKESYEADFKLVDTVKRTYPKIIDIFDEMVGGSGNTKKKPPVKK